jgi:hypothetical protein
MLGSAARRFGLVALTAAGVALVAFGLGRWRAEAAARSVAEEFLVALVDGKAKSLAATLTPALAERLRAADPTFQATLSVPTLNVTSGVQRIRMQRQTATVRAVVRSGRQQVAFDLSLVHTDEHGWKVAGIKHQPRKNATSSHGGDS